jgi:hypothetical protein
MVQTGVLSRRDSRLGECSGMTPEQLARLGAVLRRFDDLDDFSRAVARGERGRCSDTTTSSPESARGASVPSLVTPNSARPGRILILNRRPAIRRHRL